MMGHRVSNLDAISNVMAEAGLQAKPLGGVAFLS